MSSNSALLPNTRLFSLDLLRGVAILLVLCRHTPSEPIVDGSLVERVFGFFYTIGWCGVDLFFVLSGFLISGLLFSEWESTGTLDIKRFWIRRGLKIWPAYYVAYGGMVLLWCLRDLITGDWETLQSTLASLPANALFIQNYVDCDLWPHSWSLAVEEHFYLMLPAILLGLMRFIPRHRHGRMLYVILSLGLLISIAALAVRWENMISGLSWKENYYPSHTRCDSLFMGVMMCAMFRYRFISGALMAGWLTVAGLLLAATLAYLSRFPEGESIYSTSWGFTCLAVAFGPCVLAAARNPQFGSSIGFAPLRYCSHSLATIGVYSYTIYLAHSVIFGIPGVASLRIALLSRISALNVHPELLAWIDRLGFWGLSIGSGVLLSHYVERPCLVWRSKRFPSRSSHAFLPRTPELLPAPIISLPVSK